MKPALPCLALWLGCASALAQPSSAPPHPVSLLGPGATGPVVMDYLGYEPSTDTVWAPGGNTGKVFVLDAESEQVHAVDGFPTREANGRQLGPSSVTFGPKTAYVGNRADGSVCAVEIAGRRRRGCLTLDVPPDGLAYVASSKEVWATQPRTNSIALLAASETGLTAKAKVKVDGQPEGFAVDLQRGRFYTNLEDKDETLAIDLGTHAVAARWNTGCGPKGPRGLALDSARGLLFVACTDGFVVLLLDKNGAQLAGLVVGPGVDNPDIAPPLKRLFAAAGGAGTLSFVGYDDSGRLQLLRRLVTAPGVRVVVADKRGKAFAADSAGGRIWIAGP
jgi:hypothetical protein